MVVADLEIHPDSGLAGRSIREVTGDHALFVPSHRRGDVATFCPDSMEKLKPGDWVMLQTKPKTLQEVHRMNHHPKPY